MYFQIVEHNYAYKFGTLRHDKLLIVYKDLPPSQYIVQKLLEEKMGIPALRKWGGVDAKMEDNHIFHEKISEMRLLFSGLTNAKDASRIVVFSEAENDGYEMIEKDKEYLLTLIENITKKHEENTSNKRINSLIESFDHLSEEDKNKFLAQITGEKKSD